MLKPKPVPGARVQFGRPSAGAEPAVLEQPKVSCPEQSRREKPKKVKRKNDPKLIAAARELRDRWLEQVNAPGGARLLVSSGKYDVSALSVVEGSKTIATGGDVKLLAA